MKSYLVTWKNEKKSFENINSATKFAEKVALARGCNSYVWPVLDGVKDDEPFMKCEWEFAENA